MSALILATSLLPTAVLAARGRACECELICANVEAWACVALALAATAIVHTAASVAWELHLLSR